MIIRRIMIMACGVLTAVSVFAGVLDVKLSAGRQKEVNKYMDILLKDAHNEFALQHVYDAYKAEQKEYLLLDILKKTMRLNRDDKSRVYNLHLMLGTIYVKFKDLYQAEAEFEQAVKLMPTSAYGHYQLGLVNFKQRKYKRAAEEFRMSIAYASDMNDRIRAYYGLADIYALEHKLALAREMWQEIIKVRPYEASVYQKLAGIVETVLEKEQKYRKDIQSGLVKGDRKQFNKQETRQLWDLCEQWRKKVVKLTGEGKDKDPQQQAEALLELSKVYIKRAEYQKAITTLRGAKALLSENHWLVLEINAQIREAYKIQNKSPELLKELEIKAGQSKNDVDLLFELGQLLESQGKYAPAARYFKQACTLSPRDVQLLGTYRSVLENLKDDEGVKRLSRRLVELSPDNIHYKLDVARYYVEQGKLDKARQVWEAIIQEDPDQGLRYQAVARAMLRAGQLERAEKNYRHLIKLLPEKDSYRIELAELLVKRLNRARIEHALKQGTADQWLEEEKKYLADIWQVLKPAVDGGRLNLAETQQVSMLLLDNGLVSESRSVLEAARKKFPDDMKLCRMLGDVYLRTGLEQKDKKTKNDYYDKTIDMYFKAFDLAPHASIQREINGDLISLCLGYGKWPKVNYHRRPGRGGVSGLWPLMNKHMNKFYNDPEDTMSAWCLGDILQQVSDDKEWVVFRSDTVKNLPHTLQICFDGEVFRRGLGFFNDAVDRDPLFLPGYEGKAVSYTMQDSFEQAVVELRKITVIDPVNKWQRYLAIGDLFANEGQMAEALAFWNRVSERVFSDATILYNLACRYFRAEKLDRAVTMLQSAIRANPNIYGYYVTLGNIYDYRGQYGQAAEAYEQALALSKQSMLLTLRKRLADIWRQMGDQFFTDGKYRQALKQYEKIRSLQQVLERFYQQEKDQEALARLSPEVADISVQVARCYEQLGQGKKAEKIFKEVVEKPREQIRLTKDFEMQLGYLLNLRKKQGKEHLKKTRRIKDIKPRPMKLDLVKHSRVWDVAREHSITPAGVLIWGLRSYAEIDPVSGETLRSGPADKLVRFANGVEVKIMRRDNGDIIEITQAGKKVECGLGKKRVTVRAEDLQIGKEKVYVQKTSGGSEILAINAQSGKIDWQAPLDSRRLFLTGKFLVAYQIRYDQTILHVFNAQSGKLILKKDLGSRGLWLPPCAWKDKLFLLDDLQWQLKVLDVDSGEFVYTHKFEGIFPRGAMIHDGVVYIYERHYKGRTIWLHALDPASGQILWSTDMHAMSVHSPPIFQGSDIVYLNPETHEIFFINRNTGVRYSGASYKEFMTKMERDNIQFMRSFGKYLILIGMQGDVHTYRVKEKL